METQASKGVLTVFWAPSGLENLYTSTWENKNLALTSVLNIYE